MDLNVLIFDMDGVLIDVSNSYRNTIQKTVDLYLGTCLGFKGKSKTLVTKEDIALFKAASGFNNDWDLTSGLLHYLLSLSQLPPFSKHPEFSSILESVSFLRSKSSHIPNETNTLYKEKNVTSFTKKVKASGGGLKGVRKALESSWEGWLLQSGDLTRTNLIKRIFQEIYLGNQFSVFYRLPRLFYRGQGHYLQEKLLISGRILKTLQKRIRLGIASGRPRFEAELALKRFNLFSYFDSIVTLDECEAEEARMFRLTGNHKIFSKPHPYSLLRTIREISLSHPRCGYVGDVVDDIKAAQAAKKTFPILAIGFLIGQKRRRGTTESLLAAGADCVIENSKDLLRFVSPSSAERMKLPAASCRVSWRRRMKKAKACEKY